MTWIPTAIRAPSLPGILLATLSSLLVLWGGAAWWMSVLAALPWLLLRPGLNRQRPGPLEEEQDLGMEVLHAICTLPRPLGMDRPQLEAGQAGELDGPSRTRLILDCVGEGVMVLGARGDLLLSNAAARRILGLRGPLRGNRSFLDHLPLALKKLMARGLSKVRHGRREHYQLKAIQVAGKVLDLSFIRLPPSPAHPVECSLVLVTDMSQVYASSRVADGFLSCISHELRTPLTHIRAAVEILNHMPPEEPEVRQEFLEVIESQALALSGVVDDVLDYSQMESSDEHWEMEPVDVQDLLHSLRRESLGALSERSLQLEIDFGGLSTPMVLGEQHRLRQVFSRLLDNAFKFSPPGGLIRVSGREERGLVRLDVEDSGLGIDPADRETVFERFLQLNDELTDKPSGIGLGLATCRRIVERMDGRIWCEQSRLGGALFSVTLRPAARPALV